MDISKASNLERFVFDLVGRDAARSRALFADALARQGGISLASGERERLTDFGFVSGRSTHADRIVAIRDTWQRFGLMIDPHTADGLNVARRYLAPGVPMLVLETALPAKFAATIHEALGREPERPGRLAGLEQLPRRFTVMPADAQRVKDYIAQNSVP